MYRAHFKKNPTINELDVQKGNMTQPISLNVVSTKLTWHITVAPIESGKLIGAFLDKNKSQDCNNWIFEDPNPETKPAQTNQGQ
jgi:hypothetical protein